MNLRDYVIEGGLADTDPGVIASAYIADVLDLPTRDEQVAALEPSVRPAASRLASTLRRAQRGGPAQQDRDIHPAHSGPAQDSNDGQNADGGPAHDLRDIQQLNGGPAVPSWAEQNADLIAYCRDHQSDHYFIPGSGRRKLAEITADEWDQRVRWLNQQAEGTLRSAGRIRAFASLIRAAGVSTLGDVLEVAA